jgi:carbon storage regulator
MLILKRRMGEGIDVGDNVRIVLKEISGGHVKIGIEAPTDIRVKRSETATSIEEENLRAANSCFPGGRDLGCLDGIANAKQPGCGTRECPTGETSRLPYGGSEWKVGEAPDA